MGVRTHDTDDVPVTADPVLVTPGVPAATLTSAVTLTHTLVVALTFCRHGYIDKQEIFT